MTSRKLRLAAALATAALAGAACSSSSATSPSASGDGGGGGKQRPPAKCPLTGLRPPSQAVLERPALAVKVENNPLAYPLSGVDKAEIVDEELVEGGLTRFMLLFHCTDANPVGPIRSARGIDPAIMEPITHILADAGGNNQVREILSKHGVVNIDENAAGGAMFRRDRPGKSSEHTLYGDTRRLRNIGEKKYGKPPRTGVFAFGPAPKAKAKKAKRISIEFSHVETITYTYRDGRYYRSDYGHPLEMENGKRVAPANVIIEEHTYSYSSITDVAGAHSTEIDDPTGKGKALLFRDGKVYRGTWHRKAISSPVRFTLRNGKEMVFHRGQTFIELVPDHKGELKGSFRYSG